MPIYPGRRKGTWRVTVAKQGAQHEWIVEGTKAEARAFEARQRLALEVDRPTTRTAPSFGSFCVEVYRPHAETHLGSSTWNKVRRYQVETLMGHFGALKLTAFSADAVEHYKRARLATMHKGKPIKPSSINNELRVLRTILNFAKALGYPVADVAAKRLPVRGPSRVTFWTPAQIGKLCAAARVEAPELVPMIVFLANTGCRKGEALACEWSWVDRTAEMLRIPSNDSWRPKNGLPREVPISRALLSVLAVPDTQRRHPQWVFPARHGGRYAEFPKDLFTSARKRAGLGGGPHTLRHSFASAFLAVVPDMFLLAQVLGHSHERVTALYSHLLPEHLARARNAVDIAPPPEAPPDERVDEEGPVLH